MSKPKSIQDVDEPSAKTITWSKSDPLEPSEAPEVMLSRASFSSSAAKPISTTFALVKNVARLKSMVSWWGDSTSPSIQNPTSQSQTLPVSKYLPTMEDLEALTISELIDSLDYRSKPRLNPKHPTWKERGSNIVGHNYKAPADALSFSPEEASTFIRSDSNGQTQELRVELELAIAKTCWLNRDYQAMVNHSTKALEFSEEFGSIQYAAKVCFYVAIAYFGTSDFARGHQFLKHAEECKGAFREGNLINWARKEAAFYEKQVGKEKALSSRQRTDILRNSATESTSDMSSPVGGEIPGRGWQFKRRLTSMSPNPAENAQLQSSINKDPSDSRSRATASPSPNLNSLDDELGEPNEQGEA